MMRRLLLLLALITLPSLASAQSYTITPTPFQTAFDNSGRIINGACVWTYVAGTTTPATTYSNNVGAMNSNPIQTDSTGRFTAYLVPGSSYKFIYESACTPPAHGTVLRTADNISAMPTASASVDVAGTAGESITAGQAVYLSDGSGAKTAGLWYKADSLADYSATKNWVGIATVNMATGASGPIRIAGGMTGLSGLVTGSIYYVGSAGALSATAATWPRKIGQADSATSMVVTANPPPDPIGGFYDDYRISTASGSCATDATAVTKLWLESCTGNRLTLFSSTGQVETCTVPALTGLNVPATMATMYDVFVYDAFFGRCSITLVYTAWTNDTTRATALARTNGRWTKSAATEQMYLGSFRTTGVSGQTEDSAGNRLVWNYYNRLRREMKIADATANWSYNTATIRQVRATPTNQVSAVVGIAEVAISAWYSVVVGNDDASVQPMQIGIGIDSTTAYATNTAGSVVLTGPTANMQNDGTAHAEILPAVGYHTITMLEKGTGTGTTTWYGTGTYPGSATLLAWIDG